MKKIVFSIKKKKLISISIIMTLAISAFLLIANVSVFAQEDEQHGQEPVNEDNGGIRGPIPTEVTPDLILDTKAFLSFTPNPIGVNSPLLVNMWLEPPLHRARYHKGYTVTFTAPSGEEQVVTLDSYHADTTAWFEYLFFEVGTWTVRFDFHGTYYPAGDYIDPRNNNPVTFEESVYYSPSSSPELDLVVLEEQVFSWPPADLPTDYWTRPISPENREWWTIAGSWPWDYFNSDYRWAGPYVIAPNTCHVVWKKEDAMGGLIGGDTGTSSFYLGGPFGRGFNEVSIIFAGRAFRTYRKPGTDMTGSTYWQSFDIRTGEVFWERPLEPGESTPTYIIHEPGVAEVPGAESEWRKSERLLRLGSRMLKYDPYTGFLVENVTSMSGTLIDGTNVLSVQNLGGGNYRLINWSIAGNSNDFASRISSNVSFPFNNIGSYDLETGISVYSTSINSDATGTPIGTRVMAARLSTGELLWNVTTDDYRFSGSTAVAANRKYAVRMVNGWWDCWDQLTGHQIWTSELPEYPWGDFGAYTVCAYQDMFYDQSYAGFYAFDWDTGQIVWRYEATNVPFESPYGGNPWFGNSIVADGKIYAYNTEHTLGQPQTRGWGIHCINATTGEGIWNITGAMAPGAVADGYLITSNLYDGYMYSFGKGETETTVTGPEVAVPNGTPLLIKGTVMDISPGQPDTPCVSPESMHTQMNYIHMQRPIDGIYHNETITGVPVTISAIDEDNHHIGIGTTITSGYYGTFGLAWTPQEQGTYEIIASFSGDESYGRSGASTYVVVGPAGSPSASIEPEPQEPTTPDTPETPNMPGSSDQPETPEIPETSETPVNPEEPPIEHDTIDLWVIIVIGIVVIAIIAVIAYLILRRKK